MKCKTYYRSDFNSNKDYYSARRNYKENYNITLKDKSFTVFFPESNTLTNNYKVAVLLTGHVRGYLKCYKNLHNFIRCIYGENSKIDYYLHTWSTTNYDSYGQDTSVTKTDIDAIKSMYNPVSIEIENQENHCIIPILSRPISINHQLYAWKKLYNNIPNIQEYDYVVKTRFDININIEECLINQLCTIISNKNSFLFETLPHGACDIFIVSTGSKMKNFFDIATDEVKLKQFLKSKNYQEKRNQKPERFIFKLLQSIDEDYCSISFKRYLSIHHE
jgi:hypothetical protein